MKRLMTCMTIIAATIAMTGCDDVTRVDREVRQKMPVNVNDRVQVVKIQEFRDDLAYDNVRAIYVITDKETGKEFIGVSGVGIVEVGRHGCGKGCSREDER